MTRKEFAPHFYAFCETFNRTVSDDALTIWFEAFGDIPFTEFKAAVTRFIREAGSRDFPTPGELRKLCPSGARDDDRALIAWHVALKANKEWGYNASVDFDDRLINATIRMLGGWEAFRQWSEKEEPFKQREFLRNYQTLARTGKGDGSPLIGFCERTSIDAGYGDKCPPPKLIGCNLAEHPMAKRLTREEPTRKITQEVRRVARLIGPLPEGVTG